MAGLTRGETSSCANPALEAFFFDGLGNLVDVAQLEFQVFDISTPANELNPVQVHPTTLGDRAAVNVLSDCPAGHRLGVGHYVAPWTVPASEPFGAHEIRWFFKTAPAAPEQQFSEEFEILQLPAPLGDLYIAAQDIIDLGVTGLTEDKINAHIKLSQAFLERATRQWFTPRTLEFKFDGSNSDAAHFGIPIISIEFLRINNDPTNLATSSYRVYSARSYPDDRRNPRIKLIRADDTRDIYTSPLRLGRLMFDKGRQNQHVRGVFGFTEEDGSVPELIKLALKKLVIERVTQPIYTAPGSPTLSPPPAPPGVIVEQETDDHRIKYAVTSPVPRKPGLSGFTQDQQVLDIIRLYKAPIGLATPADWTVR